MTRNIQVLATELYKIVNGLSPEIMKEVFPFNENTSYNTRNKRKFHSRSIKSVAFGSETLSHLAPKIWELVPVEIKNVESVASFRKAIKMETNKLSLSSMPDVCFSGWFRVIDFMIRHKPVLLFFFSFCGCHFRCVIKFVYYLKEMFPYLVFVCALIEYVQHGFSFGFTIVAEWTEVVFVVCVVVYFLINI